MSDENAKYVSKQYCIIIRIIDIVCDFPGQFIILYIVYT